MATRTIYVYLPDEAVDVWRPVEAGELNSGLYRICGPVPEHEIVGVPAGKHRQDRNEEAGAWCDSGGEPCRRQVRRIGAAVRSSKFAGGVPGLSGLR